MIFIKAFPNFRLNITADNQYNVGPECLNYALSLHSLFRNNFKICDESDPYIRTSLIEKTVDYLNVEKSARYQPLGNSTFCNVYAHDLCHLLGVYFPRIWWRDEYLEEINYNWKIISIDYGITIFEQNCNMLVKWLNDFGGKFNWTCYSNEYDAHKVVNKGTIGLAIAKNTDSSKNGHVSILLPNSLSKVEIPKNGILQTEAGRKNRKYFYEDWWSNKDNLNTEFWCYKIDE